MTFSQGSTESNRVLSRGNRERYLLLVLAVAVITVGLFLISHGTPFLVCPLLIVPVLLVAIEIGMIPGLVMAVCAALLTCPYSGQQNALLSPPISYDIWVLCCLTYLLTAVVTGLLVNKSRNTQQRESGSHQITGAKGHASDKSYQVLLEQMNEGQSQMKRMNEELAILNTIASSINRSLDIYQVQVNALAHIGNLLNLDAVQLYELTPDSAMFTLQAARPIVVEQVMKTTVTVPATEGIIGKVMQSKAVEQINARSGDLDLRPRAMGGEIHSIMAVPLLSHAQVIAILVIGSAKENAFSQEDEKLLESVGRALTVAIENAKLFKQVRDLSLLDELTGLANRRMFNFRIALEVDRVSLSGEPLCLVIFDLDYFKKVNDTYGHLAGDEVLSQFAGRIQEQIRTSDLCCRFGGEEFALLIPDSPMHISVAIAERICRSIATTPFILEDSTVIHMTVSAGVASIGQNITTAEELVGSADHALYQAKANGRNRVEVYSNTAPATLGDCGDESLHMPVGESVN